MESHSVFVLLCVWPRPLVIVAVTSIRAVCPRGFHPGGRAVFRVINSTQLASVVWVLNVWKVCRFWLFQTVLL